MRYTPARLTTIETGRTVQVALPILCTKIPRTLPRSPQASKRSVTQDHSIVVSVDAIRGFVKLCTGLTVNTEVVVKSRPTRTAATRIQDQNRRGPRIHVQRRARPRHPRRIIRSCIWITVRTTTLRVPAAARAQRAVDVVGIRSFTKEAPLLLPSLR